MHKQTPQHISTRSNACDVLRIGEINIRGVNATGKKETLEQFGNKHKLDLICLAETKYVHTAQEGGIET